MYFVIIIICTCAYWFLGNDSISRRESEGSDRQHWYT